MSDLAAKLDQLISAVASLQEKQQRQDPLPAKLAHEVLGYPSAKALRDAIGKGDILLGEEAFQRGASEKAPWLFNTKIIIARWQQETLQDGFR